MMSGELKLWAAVIDRAAHDLLIGYADAAEWWRYDDRRHGGLADVCAMLGLNPTYVRRKTLAMLLPIAAERVVRNNELASKLEERLHKMKSPKKRRDLRIRIDLLRRSEELFRVRLRVLAPSKSDRVAA